jgi:hypothetical protein
MFTLLEVDSYVRLVVPRSADSGLFHLWTCSKDAADEVNSEGRHNNQLHCVPICGCDGLAEICSSNYTAQMQI